MPRASNGIKLNAVTGAANNEPVENIFVSAAKAITLASAQDVNTLLFGFFYVSVFCFCSFFLLFLFFFIFCTVKWVFYQFYFEFIAILTLNSYSRQIQKLFKSKYQCPPARWTTWMRRRLMLAVWFVPIKFLAYNCECRCVRVESAVRRFDPLLQCLNNF